MQFQKTITRLLNSVCEGMVNEVHALRKHAADSVSSQRTWLRKSLRLPPLQLMLDVSRLIILLSVFSFSHVNLPIEAIDNAV